jgi:hypothetical protein
MGETILNIQSSRSHTIFKMGVRMVYEEGRYLETSLCIVDLAGSERSKKAETQGAQLNEACNINKSLLVLGRCLKMLRFQGIEVVFITIIIKSPLKLFHLGNVS